MTKLLIQQFISAKSVMFIISWLMLATAIAVLGSMYYMLLSLDNYAAEEVKQRMNLALAIESKHQHNYLEEYSYWDEAYEKLVIENNIEWIADNTGEYLLEERGYDFTIAIKHNNQVTSLSKSEYAQHLSAKDIMNPGFIALTQKSRILDDETKTTNGFILLDDDLYFVVGGPFIDEELAIPREATFLAFGKHMDIEHINELALNYQLPHLSLTFATQEGINNKVLYSPSGDSIATLAWVPFSPSKKIIPAISIITIFFFMIAFYVTKLIINKEQQNRATYEEKLYLEATKDSLTNINNRRHFISLASQEFTTEKSNGNDLSIIALDIDYFKSVNDQHGHAVGDKALIHFVKVCNLYLKESDIFGRIGGEEFVVALPNTNLEASLNIANRLRIAISESPLLIDGKIIRLTVSAGVATLDKQSNLETLLQDADKALYQAKNQGRNQVVFYK